MKIRFLTLLVLSPLWSVVDQNFNQPPPLDQPTPLNQPPPFDQPTPLDQSSFLDQPPSLNQPIPPPVRKKLQGMLILMEKLTELITQCG
jgi:hypothetical protein